MRPEILAWLTQADRDLRTAKNLKTTKDYYAAAFFCQQATEKALKATCIFVNKKSPGQTHSLVFLGKEANIPARFYPALRQLGAEYYISRYPDAANHAAFDTYTEDDISTYLRVAEEILAWAKRQMKQS